MEAVSRPQVTSPTGSSALLESWMEGWAAGLRGASDCFAAMLRRGPAGLELARWMELAWAPPSAHVGNAPRDRLRGARGQAA